MNLEGMFFCYVNGRGRPKKPHRTLEIARSEAKRLQTELAPTEPVYVLQAIERFDPPPLPEVASSGRKIIRVKKVVDKKADAE
jgi:hypothetical protein